MRSASIATLTSYIKKAVLCLACGIPLGIFGEFRQTGREEMEQHKKSLKARCRACGRKANSRTHPKTSDPCSSVLSTVYSIPVDTESEDIYPPDVCNSCYLVIRRSSLRGDTGRILDIVAWSSHSDNCDVCTTGAVGRPKKRSRGRPSDDDPSFCNRNITRQISSLDTKEFTNFPIEKSMCLPSPHIDFLMCRLCQCVPRHPIELLTCRHFVCKACISACIACPCNGIALLPEQLCTPSAWVLSIMGSLLVHCKDKCGEIIELQHLTTHLQSNCRKTTIPPPSAVSLEQLVTSSSTEGLMITHMRGLLAEKLFPSGEHITCRSSTGKPLSLIRVTNPRIESSVASTRTLKRRSLEIQHIRDVVSKGSSKEQLQYEMRTLSKQDRESLLESALSSPLVIPSAEVLAMKADLSITSYKLRILRRWLGQWNIKMDSEKEERKLAKELVGPNMDSELVPLIFLTDDGQVVRKAPMAYVPNLVSKVIQILDQNDKVGRLNTQYSFIPADEIWLKLGGDKGGKSMKIHFQILNCPNPNSPANTCVFVVYEGPDSRVNLHVALDRYRAQVDELKNLTWRNSAGKSFTLKIFFSGDYAFLFQMYGLSGASGRHCCLWCLITADDMKTPRSERTAVTKRSLAGIKADHARFMCAGQGDLKKAKLFNNAIAPHFFEIELEQICLPGLHITLGVFYRLFELFEDECHKLDLEMASLTTPQAGDGLSYTNHCELVDEERSLLDQKAAAEEEVQWLGQVVSLLTLTSMENDPSTDKPLEDAIELTGEKKSNLHGIETQLTALAKKKKSLPRKHGPFVKNVDSALASFNVHRQAYYSGTFIGNHIHKTLKEVNLKTLCESVPTLARSRCLQLEAKAEAISSIFLKAFQKFGQCHTLYDSGEAISENQLLDLSKHIDNFMAFYRDSFPHATVTPKLHMLEDHVVSFLRQWKAGLGFLGEQGAESIHARFNSIRHNFVNMPNPVQRLAAILKAHLIQVCPENIVRQPAPKKRKKKLSL